MRGLTLTVSQLNEYVRRSLASDPMLHGLCLTGELSNFKRHTSGHWYFTLKDEEAAINCAMFRQAAMGVRFRPENGQRVRLFGGVGLYARTGAYQFYADAMEPDGLGELYLRFEALKQKLAAEGLFDPSLKKPLPLLPRGVGIVTSRTGAVVHDIVRVSWRRYPGMPLYLCPVKVQGEGAAAEIAAAIRLLDGFEGAEVIIVGRGGGSMEDLWAFNEEVVARAIARCHTPVVSAVGHETDVTIADFVADVRAPTPSAAAELAVPAPGCGAAAAGGAVSCGRAGTRRRSAGRCAGRDGCGHAPRADGARACAQAGGPSAERGRSRGDDAAGICRSAFGREGGAHHAGAPGRRRAADRAGGRKGRCAGDVRGERMDGQWREEQRKRRSALRTA